MTTLSQAEVFKALGDLTRLRILKLLTQGELCVCQIEKALRVLQPIASRHLSILRMTGLVQARREGQWVYYSLTPPKTQFEQLIRECIKSLQTKRDPNQADTETCLPFAGQLRDKRLPLQKSSRNKNAR